MTDERTLTAAIQETLADAQAWAIDGAEINAAKPNQINVFFSNGDEADITVHYVERSEVVRIDETVRSMLTGAPSAQTAEEIQQELHPDDEVRRIREALDQVPVRWRWLRQTETSMPSVISPEGREFALATEEEAEALAREANAIVEVRQTAFEDTRELALGIVQTYSALRHMAVRRSGGEVERIDGAFLHGLSGDLLKAALVQLGADPEKVSAETKCNVCGVPQDWHAEGFWEGTGESW